CPKEMRWDGDSESRLGWKVLQNVADSTAVALTKARDALNKALADLGIARIVCVDDMYVASIDIPGLVVWGTQDTNRQAAQGILSAQNITVDLESGTAGAELRAKLEESQELSKAFQA